MELHQNEKLLCIKGHNQQSENITIDYEKNFAKRLFNKGLIWRLDKEPLQLNDNNKNLPNKTWASGNCLEVH